MTKLEDLIPKQNRGQDAAVAAGKAALSVIPFVGPFASEGLSFALDGRQAKRQREFNKAVAHELNRVMESIPEPLTPEQLVESDEFCTAVTRAQRLASETASEDRRRWLAAAVANGGSWAPFSDTERQQFARLTEDLDPLHVWLLQYFQDPTAWLQAHNLYERHSNIYMAGVETPLESAFNSNQSVWGGPVKQAAAELERAGLASIPLGTIMSASGVFSPRTSAKGTRFLLFINETDPAHSEAPQLS